MTISSSTGIWTIGDNWPWPQVRFTSYYVLALAIKADGKLALYELTNVANTWTAEEKISIGNEPNIISVSIIDFSTYYLLTVNRQINDVADKVIYQKNVLTGAVEVVGSSTLPVATVGCNYLGQLILGGLSGAYAPWNGLSKCSIAWSDIGSIDMDPTTNVIAGFAVLPWDENGNGEVWGTIPLGQVVRVYGNQGICNMIPYSDGRTTGFGLSEVETPGILSSDAVDGDEFIHGYVDSNYDFWTVTEHGKKNRGYRDFMKTLTQRVLVRYDPHNKKFYISDGLLCYIYSKYGMYSSHQCVSSVGNYKGLLCGFFKDNEDTKIRIETNSFDLGQQGMQTIHSVECGLDYDTTSDAAVTGAISVKYDYKGDFIQLPYTPVNPRGIFTQKATGREFKIHLQADYVSTGTFRLSSLVPKFNYTDRRNIKG